MKKEAKAQAKVLRQRAANNTKALKEKKKSKVTARKKAEPTRQKR